MKRDGMCVLALVMLWTASIQAAIPPVLPAIGLRVAPENPTSSDELSLTLSGEWPDSCAPEGFELRILSGDSIWVDLLLPGWNATGNCDDLVCLQVVTPWALTQDAEPIAPGDYDVFLRAVACGEMGTYQRIGALSVAPGGRLTSGRFERGERVVLLQDDPPGGKGLKAGQAGTVVCCDPGNCAGNLLVSWDLWSSGKVDPFSCADLVPVLHPANSALWVDPGRVMLGRQFSQCGAIRKGLEGCIYFESDDGHDYNVMGSAELYRSLNGAGAIQFGDCVRLRGLLNRTPPAPGEIRLRPQRDGDIFHPIIALCPAGGGDCCGGTYQSGDRVVLLVDNPIGPDGRSASGLPAGSVGTVACCNGNDPLFPVLVSWDKWESGGRVDTSPCQAQAAAYPAQSLWLLACDQIGPAQPQAKAQAR
ncbi:MAG: hypothetical protein JW993_15940 [Sedimentisphaerales bacterium]|nr:hypothetical protein [Sedimentisphaerales bacterium]